MCNSLYLLNKDYESLLLDKLRCGTACFGRNQTNVNKKAKS